MKNSAAEPSRNARPATIKTAGFAIRLKHDVCLTGNERNGVAAKTNRGARVRTSFGCARMSASASGANTSDGYRSKGA